MKTIRVTELKTHLSATLRRVRKGERFIVLDRREAVAELAPARRPADAMGRLIAEGRVRAPRRSRRQLPPMRPIGRDIGLAELLDAVRDDA